MFNYLQYLEGKVGTFLPQSHPLKQGFIIAQKEAQADKLRVTEELQRKELLTKINELDNHATIQHQKNKYNPAEVWFKLWDDTIDKLIELSKFGQTGELSTAFKIIYYEARNAPSQIQAKLTTALGRVTQFIPESEIIDLLKIQSDHEVPIIAGRITLAACKRNIHFEFAHKLGLQGIAKIKENKLTINHLPFESIRLILYGVIKANLDQGKDIMEFFSCIWETHCRTEAKKDIFKLAQLIFYTYNPELLEWVLENLPKNRTKKMQEALWGWMRHVNANNGTIQEFNRVKKFLIYLQKYCGEPPIIFSSRHVLVLYRLLPIGNSGQVNLDFSLELAEKSEMPYAHIKHIVDQLDFTYEKTLGRLLKIPGIPEKTLLNCLEVVTNYEQAEKAYALTTAIIQYSGSTLSNPSEILTKIILEISTLQADQELKCWRAYHSHNNTTTETFDVDFNNSKYFVAFITHRVWENSAEYPKPFVDYALEKMDIVAIQTMDVESIVEILRICNSGKNEQAFRNAEIIRDYLEVNGKLSIVFNTILARAAKKEEVSWIIERLVGLHGNNTTLDLEQALPPKRGSVLRSTIWAIADFPELFIKVLKANPYLKKNNRRLESLIAEEFEDCATNALYASNNAAVFAVITGLIPNNKPWTLYSVYKRLARENNQYLANELKSHAWEWPEEVTTRNNIIQPLVLAIDIEDMWLLELLASRGFNIFKPYKGKTIFDKISEEQSKNLIDLFVEANKIITNDTKLDVEVLLG